MHKKQDDSLSTWVCYVIKAVAKTDAYADVKIPCVTSDMCSSKLYALVSMKSPKLIIAHIIIRRTWNVCARIMVRLKFIARLQYVYIIIYLCSLSAWQSVD